MKDGERPEEKQTLAWDSRKKGGAQRIQLMAEKKLKKDVQFSLPGNLPAGTWGEVEAMDRAKRNQNRKGGWRKENKPWWRS